MPTPKTGWATEIQSSFDEAVDGSWNVEVWAGSNWMCRFNQPTLLEAAAALAWMIERERYPELYLADPRERDECES